MSRSAAALLFCAAAGLAQQAAPEESPRHRMGEVTVTATRAEALVFGVPYGARTLGRDYLQNERMARTVPEALSEVPGVMVQKTSRGQGSPFLRGFTGFRTLFLIDGIRLNNSVFREGPNQYAGTIDPLTLERLEVVKGPSSVLYGSDAIGGTVNAITRERDEYGDGFDWDRRVYYRFASAEQSHTARGEVSASHDDVLGILIGASWRDYGDLIGGPHLREMEGTAYEDRDADAKVNWRLYEHVELVFAYQRSDIDHAARTHRTTVAESWRGTGIGTDRKLVFDQRRDLAYVQLKVADAETFFRDATVSVSFQRQEEVQDRVQSNGRRTRQGFDVATWGLWFTATSPTPVGDLSYGAEWYHDDVNSFRDDVFRRTLPRGPVADDTTYDLGGVYLQDDVTLWERLDLIAGGRITFAQVDANEVDPDPTDAIVVGPIEDDWTNVSGSLRLLYHAGEHWNPYVGVSQGFRAPNVSDLTSFDIAQSGDLETPSPGLKPEEYVTFEAGVKAEYDVVQGSVAYFYTIIDGMLVRSPTGAIVGGLTEVRRENVGEGYVQGVELEARARVWGPVSAFGNLAWVEGRVDQFGNAPDTELRARPLSKVQPLTGLVGLRWDHESGKYWAEVFATVAGEQMHLSPGDARDTQRIPPGGTPGYVVWTVRGGADLCENARATLAVENFTDRDYRIHGSGQNEAGINVVMAIDVRH